MTPRETWTKMTCKKIGDFQDQTKTFKGNACSEEHLETTMDISLSSILAKWEMIQTTHTNFFRTSVEQETKNQIEQTRLLGEYFFLFLLLCKRDEGNRALVVYQQSTTDFSNTNKPKQFFSSVDIQTTITSKHSNDTWKQKNTIDSQYTNNATVSQVRWCWAGTRRLKVDKTASTTQRQQSITTMTASTSQDHNKQTQHRW